VRDEPSGDTGVNEPSDGQLSGALSRGAARDNSADTKAQHSQAGDDAANPRPPDPAAAKPGRRRRLWKWLTGSPSRKALSALGAVVLAAVTGVAGAVAGGIFSGNVPISAGVTGGQSGNKAGSNFQAGVPTGASALGCSQKHPVPFLASVYHETHLNSAVLGATVSSGKLSLSKSELQLLNTEGNYAWLARRGGYDLNATQFKLTLTGCKPLRILGMRAVILTRQPPPAGTIFLPASQGASGSLPIRLNLDSNSPVATMFDASGHSYNYFEKNTFTLAPGEQHTFEVAALTTRWAVTWKLDVEFLVHNRVASQMIGNGDQPFRTAAQLPPGPGSSTYYQEIARYQAAYSQCYGYNPEPWPTPCAHASGVIWVRVK
jgi:hypothetical protein